MAAEHVDAVVVGSGFGGSVTAYRLAKEGIGVCLLERGKPYPPGSFARTPHAMRTNFWDPSAGLQGLFDIWSFDGIDAVISAGLGGGSLIYANVFIRKDEHWFDRTLPDGTRELWPVDRAQLDPHYDRVEQIVKPTPYPFGRAPYDATPKTRAYQEAAAKAGIHWELPDLAITFGNDPANPVPGEQIREQIPNLHGLPRTSCQLVGECNVGCNVGAKNTLDFNYLTLAAHHGADLRTRCEVRSFAPRPEGGWLVRYVEHVDPPRPGTKVDTSRLPLREIACERLILSAGTLGTTYLLLRNAVALGGLPAPLGTRFSGNGDLLGFVANARRRIGGEEEPWILEAPIGPAITSTIRVPDASDPGGTGPGFYIQEGGYPAFASWMQEALGIPGELRRLASFVLHRVWAQVTHSPDANISDEIAGVLGDAEDSATILPMLGMGRDTPDGTMSLDEGLLALHWNEDTSEEYLKRVRATMRQLGDALGGDLIQNPLSHLRRLITVHPLGGCPMGVDARTGVVDPFGRVFGHEGLHVADGSVMPGPVGPNPSFTIAALADRFADAIVAEHRGETVEAAA
jgi:cholesterol oxidase